MKTKHFRRLALISLLLLISTPCSYVQVQLTEPPPTALIPSSVPSIEIQSTFTSTATVSDLEQPAVSNVANTATFILTSTVTRTFTPTFLPTFTFTFTNTPLPPLPEFDEVLSFGFGGGGGVCPGIDQKPNSMEINQGGQFVGMCFWLKGFDTNRPFQVVISRLDGPVNVYLTTPNLFFETRNGRLKWDGYAGYSFSDCGERKGIAHCYNLLMWSPVELSVGKWRISIVQKQSNFGVYSQDFLVEREYKKPYISTLSSHPKTEINPMQNYYSHHVITKNNGKVDVIGANFPPNVPIYILLYRQTSDLYGQDMRLINKQVVQSDFNGSVYAELPGPFDTGLHYIAVGVSNPESSLADESHRFDFNAAPYDSFIAINSGSNTSCLGAPPQRMIVNQRGYVCTQSDRVRLRNAPAKSADTIVYINTGTQFTVIGGPSCSDNWSWWNVRLDNGATGWLAEGGDAVDPYFICPLP